MRLKLYKLRNPPEENDRADEGFPALSATNVRPEVTSAEKPVNPALASPERRTQPGHESVDDVLGEQAVMEGLGVILGVMLGVTLDD